MLSLLAVIVSSAMLGYDLTIKSWHWALLNFALVLLNASFIIKHLG